MTLHPETPENNNNDTSAPKYNEPPRYTDSSHMIPEPTSPDYGYGSQPSPDYGYGSQPSPDYGSNSQSYGSAYSGQGAPQEETNYGSIPSNSYGSSSMDPYGGQGSQPVGIYNPMPSSYDAQSYQSQGGYYGQPTNPTNTMSIVSLIVSCVSLFTGGLLAIVGVILGHIGLKQIKQNNEEGRGLALTGLIIGYVQIAFVVLAVIFFLFLIVVGAASGA